MRIWIDLANSPHVPFFSALIKEFAGRGHEVELTARDFAETVDLAHAAGLQPQTIGKHGGRGLFGKAVNLLERSWALRRWARGRSLDLAVSHNSYTQILAARSLGLKTVTLMDYEHQPANHLAFRFASRIIVPDVFPKQELIRHGADLTRVRRYNGAKEDVYLADFERDPSFAAKLHQLGVNDHDVLVTVRPPAHDALYHRFENQLFDELLDRLLTHPEVKIVLLPRNVSQRSGQWLGQYRNAVVTGGRLIIPSRPLDGPNLIAASDLVISAGGTMNREAAALGVPAATIYAGQWAAIDEKFMREGKLMRIQNREDLNELPLQKRSNVQVNRAKQIRREVAELILAE